MQGSISIARNMSVLDRLHLTSSECRVNRNLFRVLLLYTSIVVISVVVIVEYHTSLQKFATFPEDEKCAQYQDSGNVYSNQSMTTMRRSRLRLDYTKLERLSSLAKKVEAMQGNCNLTKQGIVRQRNYAGLGSDIHTYSLALCMGLELKSVRVRNVGPWIWKDEKHCQEYDNAVNDPWKSPMKCYFPESENLCPKDDALFDDFQLQNPQRTVNLTDGNGTISHRVCPKIIRNSGGRPAGVAAVRAATTEFLFTRVADIVQQEGQRQLELVFGINCTHGSVPNNLITVHIRWGDKGRESSLFPITAYIDAVHEIIGLRRADGKNDTGSSEEVNIFLSTEDPEAVEQFFASKPDHWKVYLDQYYKEYLPYRLKSGNEYNNHVTNAKERGSQMGLVALGSLLVAMESNDFVWTTTSNWSRLMNEIRKNIINPRCGNCTRIVDLRAYEFR